MTNDESLDSITHLSQVIGWLQRQYSMRSVEDQSQRQLDILLRGLVEIRERIRKDYVAQKEML